MFVYFLIFLLIFLFMKKSLLGFEFYLVDRNSIFLKGLSPGYMMAKPSRPLSYLKFFSLIEEK